MRQEMLMLGRRGYSLVGLLVAVSLGVIVCLGAAYVMTRAHYTSNFASLQSELDRLHYLNLQKARNLAYIRQQLGLPANANLQDCFAQKKSKTCSSLSGSKNVPKEGVAGSGLDKNLDSEMVITSECSGDTCQRVKVTVDTTYTTPPTQIQRGNMMVPSYSPRHTVVYYPAFVIAPPVGIDYGCAFTELMTGVSASELTAICSPVTGNLNGGNPLSNFGGTSPTPSTQPPTNTTCGPGQFVAQVGMFAGQTVCKTVAVNPPPPPPTVTLPPTTTLPRNMAKCEPGKDPGCIRTTIRECFLAGTPVLMADGSRKAIEQIQKGEMIVAYDEISGQRFDSPVTEALHHPAKLQQLYRFTMDNGATFTSNNVHLIYVPSLHGYFAAEDIAALWRRSPDLSLMNADGSSAAIVKIDSYADVVPMYNLHVRGLNQLSPRDLGRGHNYFVDGVLVHNAKCVEYTSTGGCTAFSGGHGMNGAMKVWDGSCYPSALTLISNFDIGYNGNMARGDEISKSMSSSECQTLPRCNTSSCSTPEGGGYCVHLINVDRWKYNLRGSYCTITEAHCLCPNGAI
jgi:hypothetical protein